MRLPDRGPPSSHPMPWRLLPGTSADVLWTRGDIAQDKLPRLRAPLSGWIATANTDPFGFTADGDVENDPFYYGAFFANGMRLAAIQDHLQTLLASGKKLTRADMESLQRDQHSVMADAVIPKLIEAWKHADTDPALAKWKGDAELSALVDRLTAWDRAMGPDSGDALVALGVEWFAAKAVTQRGLGKLLFEAIAEKSPPFIMGVLRNVLDARFAAADSLLPEGGRDALLLGALDETRAWLLARFKTTDPSKLALKNLLAAEFPTSFGRKLDVGRTPIGGSFDTIDVAPAPFFEQKGDAFVPRDQLACTEMAMYRMVIGFDDDGTPRATFDFARGTSEEPGSPHFGDRQAEWTDGAHVPLYFRRTDVEAHTESRVVLGGVD
jgi:penicillin amidase